MIENIKLAFQGIWAHKMRSCLTMLGIIIGIASIIAIVSTIKGTNEQIKQNLIGSGNNAVKVELYQGDYPLQLEYEKAPDGVTTLSPKLRDKIAEMDAVEAVSFYHGHDAYDSIFYQNTALSGGRLLGIDDQYFEVQGYQVSSGRGFGKSDYENYRKVALLDSVAVRALFQNEDPIGKTLEIKGEPYVVIGVVKTKSSFQPVINTIEDYYNYMTRSSGNVFVPDSTWPIIYQFDEPQSVLIRATQTETMTAAGKGAADLINQEFNITGDVKFKSEDLLKEVQGLQEISQSTNTQLIWIASISLLVGGIGVMNIMLVSVTERTREIGLKKALGARKSRILWQFLTEAAVLTSLGGFIGVGSGIGLAFGISKLSSVPVAVSASAVLISVVFSMLIGILFGLLPAVKASKLNPIDALQHE